MTTSINLLFSFYQPLTIIIPSHETDQMHDSSTQIKIFLDIKRAISNRNSRITLFASDVRHKSISIIPYTNNEYTSINPDVDPITQLYDNKLRIEISNAIIILQTTFMQDFEEYINSMQKLIGSLISNFTTNPLSEPLLYFIQKQTRLYISTDGSRTNTESEYSWIISLLDGTVMVSD